MNNEWIWTDELAFEFRNFNCNKNWDSEALELFKKSKRPKEPLFTTEDKVDIYEGMYYWFVSKKFDVLYQDNANKYLDDGSARFAIEDNANEYVLMNKPCLSLNDFGEWYEKWYSNNPMKEAYLNGLKELAKQKING